MRVNYRDATHLLGNIDAEFIECSVGFPEQDGRYTIRFYPQWLHPRLSERPGECPDWRFPEEAARSVTIYPKRVVAFHLSRRIVVVDWDITDQHPILWGYDDSCAVHINQPLSSEQLETISKEVQEGLTGYDSLADVGSYFRQDCTARWGREGAFCLGVFPHTVFEALKRVLLRMQIEHFVPHRAGRVRRPLVCLLDDNDYIVAEDFELDVPEFEHRPEWLVWP